jgi:conjugal transfer pilus assembly protein TraE
LGVLLKQRNIFITAAAILLACNLLLSLSTFWRTEKVIVVPPEVKQSFWVEGGKISNSYLEEMTLFFAHLILDASPITASYQRDVLLRYATPESYGTLKTQLLEDEKRLIKDNLSISFRPASVVVDNAKLEAQITGDIIGYVGSQRISQTRETYKICYQYVQGKLLILSFQHLGGENK